MFDLRKGRSLLRRYREDEGGNMALMFAVSAVAVVGCMGAAMDFSTRSNAKMRSQSIADQIALAAAIYVKNNDTPPKEASEGYMHGTHTAKALGFDYKGWVDGGSAGVNVVVTYDDVNKEANVVVSGKTVPTFMQVLGKHDMSFEASATVSYLQVEDMQPASVVMVLDNSGSMRWDERKLLDNGNRVNNPMARIDRLKASVRKFRNDLRARIGDQKRSSGQRILRTGILPYNSDIIDRLDDKDRRVGWGFSGVSETLINEMKAEGSTNSNPPMAKAKEWLEDEDRKHEAEANRYNVTPIDPIYFVLFMTDGQNTSGEVEFVADDSTGYYYKKINGQWWYTSSQAYAGNNGFKEGKLQLDSDRKTLESCTAMKNDGVKIFTLGYALDVGKYYDPLYPNNPGEVTEATKHTAYALLSSCASEGAFIEVGSGASLQGAFDQIQNSIVTELIRIKS